SAAGPTRTIPGQTDEASGSAWPADQVSREQKFFQRSSRDPKGPTEPDRLELATGDQVVDAPLRAVQDGGDVFYATDVRKLRQCHRSHSPQSGWRRSCRAASRAN